MTSMMREGLMRLSLFKHMQRLVMTVNEEGNLNPTNIVFINLSNE